MSWLDIVAIVIWVLFLALGAKVGGIWTGACIIGGFAGSFVTDTYALPISSLIGPFPGSVVVAAALLFLLTAGVILLPSWLIDRIQAKLFLGVINGFFGLITGALVGVMAIGLLLLALPPRFPALEKSPAWKKSMLVKNYQLNIEKWIQSPHFRPVSLGKVVDEVVPAVEEGFKAVKTTTRDVMNEWQEKGD